MSPDWESVSEEKMKEFEESVSKVASKIGKAKPFPGMKEKMIFSFMKKNQESNAWNPLDQEHWKEQGWLDGKSPWK